MLHYGLKNHLANFYFDRLNILNFVNKNVWVPIVSNPCRPNKKIWVPKFSPLVVDVGVGSHKTWEDWCHGGGCIEIWRTHPFDASLLRKHGGRTTSCLEKWIGYTILVTISFSILKYYECLYASVVTLTLNHMLFCA